MEKFLLGTLSLSLCSSFTYLFILIIILIGVQEGETPLPYKRLITITMLLFAESINGYSDPKALLSSLSFHLCHRSWSKAVFALWLSVCRIWIIFVFDFSFLLVFPWLSDCFEVLLFWLFYLSLQISAALSRLWAQLSFAPRNPLPWIIFDNTL